MNSDKRPIATREDWLLRNTLLQSPDCCMMDEKGRPMAPWQQNLSRQLCNLYDSRRWCPLPYEKDGRQGLWNQFDDRVCIPPIYDAVGEIPGLGMSETNFSDPVPVRKGVLWGLVSSDGRNRTLLPIEFQEVRYLDGSHILVKQFGRYGLLFLPIEAYTADPDFPCIAESISYDETIDRFVFIKGGRLGLIGITEAVFDGFALFDDDEESIVAIKDGRKGFLTLEGEFFAMDSVFLPVNARRLHHWEISPLEYELLKIRDC